MDNIILQTDSYKVSHWKQYPKNTEFVYSYFESRGGAYSHTLFFGLQYYLKKYLLRTIVTDNDIYKAHNFAKGHFGNDFFNLEGWNHIVKDHDGHMPVVIKAVPEGRIIPTSNVLFTVENTCPKCFWITSYLETLL
ncbi:MAG: nicotinamide phosphoribosyltransferase domain-containing protein, partial [Rhabdochlamydiaceae bacterium]